MNIKRTIHWWRLNFFSPELGKKTTMQNLQSKLKATLLRSRDPTHSYLWMNAKKRITVFPLMLLPFMSTVFTEVLLIRPWTIYFWLYFTQNICGDYVIHWKTLQSFQNTFETRKKKEKGKILSRTHLKKKEKWENILVTCISVLRVSEVRRQSDKSSCSKKTF